MKNITRHIQDSLCGQVGINSKADKFIWDTIFDHIYHPIFKAVGLLLRSPTSKQIKDICK